MKPLSIYASCTMAPRWVERFDNEYTFEFRDWWATKTLLPKAEFIPKLAGRHILITEFDEVDRDVIEASPDLFMIADCRGGTVNIDKDAATEHGVIVTNTPGGNAESVADLTVALMVMISRNLLRGINTLYSGGWVEAGFEQTYLNHMGLELPGKTVGLIGMGFVGQRTAHRLRGFDMHVLGYDPYVKQEAVSDLGVTMVDMDTLLAEADYVSLHVPVLPSTRGMFGAREFGLMKPSAFFINTARAALVDEAAMVDALTDRKIAGAALDVFHTEPLPSDYPLLKLPNVIALPHLGGATFEVADHHAQIAYESIQGFLSGSPINVQNPDALAAATEKMRSVVGS